MLIWDPSIAGNGNSADASLDGYIGNNSAISLLVPTNQNLLLYRFSSSKALVL